MFRVSNLKKIKSSAFKARKANPVRWRSDLTVYARDGHGLSWSSSSSVTAAGPVMPV
jgi:hypothetical protein